MKLKRFFPTSFMGRSLIILIAPVLLVQIVTTLVFFDNHWSRMTTRLAFAVAGEVSQIAHKLDENIQNFPSVSQDSKSYFNLDLTLLQNEEVPENDKKSHLHYFQNQIVKSLGHELSHAMPFPTRVENDFSGKWVYIYVWLEKGVLKVQVPQRRLFSSSSYIVILWMIGVSILVLIIAIIFMRNQIRPIRKLALAAERIGKGGDVTTFKPTGSREVRAAGDAFLAMQRRIKRHVEQRTMMLAGVSHDLRTPLTRLKLQLELLENEEDREAMQSDISDMERMITGYLDFARGVGNEDTTFTNVSDLLASVIGKTNADIKSDLKPDIHIMAKPLALKRAFTNILENAKEYGDTTYVTLNTDEKYCNIIIEDDGIGIPEDKLEDVLKPFYRSDSARVSDEGHVGLGLCIASDIIQNHGGTLKLGSSKHGGLKVEMRLPV